MMSGIKRMILNQAKEELQKSVIDINEECVLYITTCSTNERAIIWRTSASTFEKAWSKVIRYLEKYAQIPRWVKIEWQTSFEKIPPSEAIRQISRVQRNNYFPYGIAFKNDGSCSFTSEEIVGNALLTPKLGHKVGKNAACLELNLTNIQAYIRRKYQRVIPNLFHYFDNEWAFFQTEGIFIENGNIYPLEKDFYGHGIRKITEMNQFEMIDIVITEGMNYLSNQISEDGAFIYGYYPTYNKRIPGYNSVRHFSSIYSLLETIEYSKNSHEHVSSDFVINKVKSSIEWGIQNLCIERSGTTFVVEPTKSGLELKLGAQAMAILAIAKYESVTHQDSFHPILLNLLKGIRCFIDETGRTTHVLNEDLTVKEKFRIIYYDGEALFAIMRAYPLTQDKTWLELGEMLMKQFIANNYERYHDHWLSYSVNELTLYIPEKEYFEFGIRNVLKHLDFIDNRDTAYPTFLELLCAASTMFDRIERSQYQGKLYTYEQYQKVKEIMTRRALHELKTGVMWPEIAQYFSRPETILYGFYARHDRMRMRIDDAEHFLSGLVNYLIYSTQEQRRKEESRSSLSMDDFNYFTGEWLDSEIAKNVKIEDFEYFPVITEKFKNENIAFLNLTDERIEEIVGKKVYWGDRHRFLKNNFQRFSLIVTEEPIGLSKPMVAQFIVPDVWEFMHEVATFLRNDFSGPVIGITGSVGKSSTRLMINHLLDSEFQLLTNRGNHNTRLATPLYLNKLILQPDILNLELSLNTLNSRDKRAQSVLVRPTIAIVTSVDYAHMSGVSNLKMIAKVKSRIFEGLSETGVAIINRDIEAEAFEVIHQAAKSRHCHVLTYSMKGNLKSDLSLVKMKTFKYLTEVTVSYREKRYTYYLTLPSSGMVENSLATFLTLVSLKLNPENYFSQFLTFKSLPKVMTLHSGKIEEKQVDMIDDTHNAAIPSMINAIATFSDRTFYYSGSKILALGQIADLGDHSKQLHTQLIPYINQSGADYFFGYGMDMREVVEEVSLPAFWFNNLDEYVEGILNVLSDKGLILLKGSVSASDYHQISDRLLKRINK